MFGALNIILSGVKTFAAYGPLMSHVVAEIPDIATRGKALVTGIERIVDDTRTLDAAALAADAGSIMKTVAALFDDVGISPAKVADVVAKAPALPSLSGLEAFVPSILKGVRA